jgi:hypothetical protein
MVGAVSHGPRILYALMQGLFANLDAIDCLLAISKMLALLDWLAHEGAVRSQPQNGLVFWRREA